MRIKGLSLKFHLSKLCFPCCIRIHLLLYVYIFNTRRCLLHHFTATKNIKQCTFTLKESLLI